MLTVTERAAHFLLEALDSREEASGQLLRIVISGDSYELTLDEPQERDEVIQFDGRGYLLLAPDVWEALFSATIDVHETAEGAPLKLTLTTG